MGHGKTNECCWTDFLANIPKRPQSLLIAKVNMIAKFDDLERTELKLKLTIKTQKFQCKITLFIFFLNSIPTIMIYFQIRPC